MLLICCQLQPGGPVDLTSYLCVYMNLHIDQASPNMQLWLYMVLTNMPHMPKKRKHMGKNHIEIFYSMNYSYIGKYYINIQNTSTYNIWMHISVGHSSSHVHFIYWNEYTHEINLQTLNVAQLFCCKKAKWLFTQQEWNSSIARILWLLLEAYLLVSKTPFVEKTIFLVTVYSWHPHWRLIDHMMWIYFWAAYSVLLVNRMAFASTILFWLL